jgi:hypothetical protein
VIVKLYCWVRLEWADEILASGFTREHENDQWTNEPGILLNQKRILDEDPEDGDIYLSICVPDESLREFDLFSQLDLAELIRPGPLADPLGRMFSIPAAWLNRNGSRPKICVPRKFRRHPVNLILAWAQVAEEEGFPRVAKYLRQVLPFLKKHGWKAPKDLPQREVVLICYRLRQKMNRKFAKPVDGAIHREPGLSGDDME